MRIACLQMDMRLGEVDANFRKASLLVEAAMQHSPDVLLLPETWNTGFFPQEDLQSRCDADGEKVQEIFGNLAKHYAVNIVAGSVSDLRDGNVYNTAYIFDRSGRRIASYSKTHLFTPMGEDKAYAPGDSLCTFTLDGIPCGILICYDIRFPELARTLALQGTQLLFLPSQWPAERLHHLHSLLTARAIENQMFVACCNSCGKTANSQFGGESMILDPVGAKIAHAGTGEEILLADIDISAVSAIRKSINVFHDRRPELYRL